MTFDDEGIMDSSENVGVRVHIVMKEPAKLSKAAADALEDVVAWKENWTRYFREAKRTDVASAAMETGALKVWNLLLSRSAGPARLTEMELANLPALEVAELILAFLSPLVKNGGAEGLSVLKSMKDKAKFMISGESY